MHNGLTVSMPKNFPQRVHQALRTWHDPQPKGVLGDLVLAHTIKAARGAITARGVSNQILMNGLDRLRLLDAEAHDLLQRRFPNNETARAVAFRLNVSEDVIFQRQRTAVAQLSAAIWEQELAARRERLQRLETRLEPPTYTKLFGVDDKIAEVRGMLESPSEPWILSLEGMGGAGKTALADTLAREMATNVHFQDIVWVSMRQRFFELSSAVEISRAAMELTVSGLLAALIQQLGLTELQHQSADEQFAGIRGRLQSQPSLIVIDNIETMDDHHALLPYLRETIAPSKCVVTSRYSLQGESGVYILKLTGLSLEDTLTLVRHEAGLQGLHQLANAGDTELAPIYHATGGNPLATKLVVGQAHIFPLAQILDRLQGSEARADEELLTFIHRDAWQRLDSHSRQVLMAMVFTGDGGGRIEQVAAASGLDLNLVATALHRLASLSLIIVIGGLNERRYALHPLTRAFVASQVRETMS